MKRKKVPDSEKLVAVNLYIEGRASQGQLAEMYGVRKASVQQWIRNFESMGNDAFQQKNRKYSTISIRSSNVVFLPLSIMAEPPEELDLKLMPLLYIFIHSCSLDFERIPYFLHIAFCDPLPLR